MHLCNSPPPTHPCVFACVRACMSVDSFIFTRQLMFPNVSFACRIFAAAYIKQQSLTFPQQRPTIGAQLGVRNILMCVCLKTTVANSTCQAINYWWTDKPGRQTTALLLLLLLFLLLHYLLQPLLLLQQQCAHLKDCNRTHTYKTAIHQADTIAQDNNNSMCR